MYSDWHISSWSACTPFAGLPYRRVMKPPLKRPFTTHDQSLSRMAWTAPATIASSQLWPSEVPKQKPGSLPLKRRGRTLAIECASHSRMGSWARRSRAISLLSSSWYGLPVAIDPPHDLVRVRLQPFPVDQSAAESFQLREGRREHARFG